MPSFDGSAKFWETSPEILVTLLFDFSSLIYFTPAPTPCYTHCVSVADQVEEVIYAVLLSRPCGNDPACRFGLAPAPGALCVGLRGRVRCASSPDAVTAPESMALCVLRTLRCGAFAFRHIHHEGGEKDHPQGVGGELLIADRHAAKLLQTVDEPVDVIPLVVEPMPCSLVSLAGNRRADTTARCVRECRTFLL
jgi:hypothetical protein